MFNNHIILFLRSAPPHPRKRARHHPHIHCKLCNLSRRQFLTLAPLALPLFPQAALSRGLSQGEAASYLSDINWPAEWPYTKSDFSRYDESADGIFYTTPRLVRHIDSQAIGALTQYYAGFLGETRDVLDVCSSVESYLPGGWEKKRDVIGLGMNAAEMERNEALTGYVVKDLNVDEKLPFGDGLFDMVMCNVSIDYLVRPLDVVREMGRVLRNNGYINISFSDRVFGSKAVAVWMGGGDLDHIYTVASYIHFAGMFSAPRVVDLSPRKNGRCTGDPLYVLCAKREV